MDLKFLIYSNTDLVTQFSNNIEKIKNHLSKNGEFEKRLYTDEHSNLYYNYDWDSYINNNSDIINSGFTTKIEALKHYFYYGKKEGRKIYKLKDTDGDDDDYYAVNSFKEDYKTFLVDFNNNNKKNYDWDRYIEENSDLGKNGISDTNSAFKHYMKFGLNEGRNIYFTKKYYMDKFVESKENIKELKKHIILNKDDKSIYYKLVEKYDWVKYIKNNKDLYEVIKTDLEAVKHYINHGVHEGRDIFKLTINDKKKYKNEKSNDNLKQNNVEKKIDKSIETNNNDNKNFNLSYLLERKNSYGDLNSLNFDKNDIMENTFLRDNVNDWKKYISENNDLKKNNVYDETEAFKHYILFGKKEKRKLCKFDYNFDGSENDLDELNEVSYIYLYENYDWDRYLKDNDDLSENKVFNDLDACMHYIKKGNNEDRILHRKDFSKIEENVDSNDNIITNNIDKKVEFTNKSIYKDEKYFKGIEIDTLNLSNLFLLPNNSSLFNTLLEFDQKYYLLMNKDVLDVTNEIDSINHFIKFGMKECRPYSKKHYYLYLNYDWQRYIREYDLKDYNIFYNRDAFSHYVKNVIYGNEDYDIYLLYSTNTFNSEFYDKFYSLNNSDTSKNFNTFLLNLEEDKIFYNHANYFIYKIIDWESFMLNNKKLLDGKITNARELFKYFIRNISSDKNFKLKFDLHYLSKDLIENIDKVYNELDDFIHIINKNIIKNDNNFLLDVLSINDFFIKFEEEYHIIHIPDFYVFNNIIPVNQNINFTFVIYSYNNRYNLENNLSSIAYQNYKKWNIIYYNDYSSDETENIFKELIKKYSIEDRVTYLSNSKKMGKLYCKYEMYKKVNIDNVIIILDGNDWLNSNSSLSILANKYDQDKDLVVYSSYMSYSKKKINKTFKNFTFNENIKKNLLYRTHYILDNHYNISAYANLFKQIPKKYLQYNEEWIDNSSNLGEFLCLAELSAGKINSLNDSTYILNEDYNNYYYGKNRNNEINNELFNEYSRNLEPIKSCQLPIYIISYTYAGFNEDILKDYMNSCEIFNYDIIIMDNFKKNKDKNFKFYKEKNISERNIMSLNYIYNILKCFDKINTCTNYDHIYILNSDLVFFNEFDLQLNIIDEDLENKDFIFIGYEEFNNTTNSLGNIVELNNYNNIEDKNLRNNFAFICSRKFRNYILKYDLNYFYDNACSFIDMIILIKNKEYLKYDTDLTIYSYNDNPLKKANNINKIKNEEEEIAI